MITAIDTRAAGYAVVRLGGGRTSPQQSIDHAVGFDRLLPRGARVTQGDPLARVHAASTEHAAIAADALRRAFTIGTVPVETPPLVERIG